jgi:hypothetical protein
MSKKIINLSHDPGLQRRPPLTTRALISCASESPGLSMHETDSQTQDRHAPGGFTSGICSLFRRHLGVTHGILSGSSFSFTPTGGCTTMKSKKLLLAINIGFILVIGVVVSLRVHAIESKMTVLEGKVNSLEDKVIKLNDKISNPKIKLVPIKQ